MLENNKTYYLRRDFVSSGVLTAPKGAILDLHKQGSNPYDLLGLYAADAAARGSARQVAQGGFPGDLARLIRAEFPRCPLPGGIS